jgi:hypothetical protein
MRFDSILPNSAHHFPAPWRRNVAGGAADEEGGFHWRRFPDLLALDQKAKWLERTTGKRNL